MNKNSEYYKDTRALTTAQAYTSANLCKLWLENSGPLYTEMDCLFSTISDESIIVIYEHEEMNFHRRCISYASWLMCQELNSADPVCLKVRCDDFAIESGFLDGH